MLSIVRLLRDRGAAIEIEYGLCAAIFLVGAIAVLQGRGARKVLTPRRTVSRIVDTQLDLDREDHRDGLPRGVIGPLIRMCASPRRDPGKVAIDRRQVVPLGGLERG